MLGKILIEQLFLIFNCLRFAHPAEALAGSEVWRLGGLEAWQLASLEAWELPRWSKTPQAAPRTLGDIVRHFRI